METYADASVSHTVEDDDGWEHTEGDGTHDKCMMFVVMK